jgi:LPS sulfotransferase NodH
MNAVNRPSPRLFFVIGVQRTGTTLLREVLNRNPQVMMMAEVLLPYPDSCHWEHFAATLPADFRQPADEAAGFALLDRYFSYLHAEMTIRWSAPGKAAARAYGVDIKLDQLDVIRPDGWPDTASPFLLHYAMRRGVVLINTVRRNVIHCAISYQIGTQKSFWHNYDNRPFGDPVPLDFRECLNGARTILRQQRAFEETTAGYPVERCDYEDLAAAVDAAPGGDLSRNPGPLRGIAGALGVDCAFHFDGRLHRAINRPYRDIISNHTAVVEALKATEFAAFAETL